MKEAEQWPCSRIGHKWASKSPHVRFVVTRKQSLQAALQNICKPKLSWISCSAIQGYSCSWDTTSSPSAFLAEASPNPRPTARTPDPRWFYKPSCPCHVSQDCRCLAMVPSMGAKPGQTHCAHVPMIMVLDLIHPFFTGRASMSKPPSVMRAPPIPLKVVQHTVAGRSVHSRTFSLPSLWSSETATTTTPPATVEIKCSSCSQTASLSQISQISTRSPG